jgi:hypothetical protein
VLLHDKFGLDLNDHLNYQIMKKISLFTCCFIIISSVYSQKAKFGFTTGATFGTYKLKVEPVSVTSKSKAGFTLGIISDIPIGHSASFMPAINFVQKGGMLKLEGTKDRLTTNFLEVPLNFVFNAKLTNGKLFIGAGPSLNVGLSGKDKLEAQGYSENQKIKFGKDKDFKTFDAGLNVVSGYISKSGVMVSFNYNTSLMNSANAGEEEGKFYNRYFGLRIGYIL